MQTAAHTGMPMVGFNDSGGARIQEAVDALSGYGQVFYQNVLLSGVVPQIAVICGPCAGGAAYSPALMDFIIMTKSHADLFITGPEVIKAVTGKTVTMDEVGGAAMHATVSGNVHFVADDDRSRHPTRAASAELPADEQRRGPAPSAERRYRREPGRGDDRADPRGQLATRWTRTR